MRPMPHRSPEAASSLAFLQGGGEMGARMRAMDWLKTPLGPVDAWPQSLRSTVSMLLPSKAQIILFWGPEFTVLYNDAYRAVFGAKHPYALGLPGREAWSEIWDSMLHELLANVVRTGEAFWAKDLLFEVERYGFLEETYFDVSYDPVRVESGEVGGVNCIVAETTERVVGVRRMALLKDLAEHNATARNPREACIIATETLAAKPHDVTFALAYLGTELQSWTPGAEEKLASSRGELVKELPISIAGARAGRLVVGLNPRRPFDDQYRAFLELVADQLGTALTNARAYEEERKRAEALAEIDRAKTAFFSNVSHEFRTPLTLMLGPTEAALAGPDRTLNADDLEMVHRNQLRLLKLVNTLLDFSRIEAGRTQAVYRLTDIAKLTRELAAAFQSTIEHAGLDFVVTCQDVAAPVYVDRDMWEKVVLNLLSNAFKFTFEGSIHVTLTEHDGRIEFSVRDSGTGIPEDEVPLVFERFHRVAGARSRTHEGSGIGLALTSELVRLHQGSITVSSRVGEGSTFTVQIPTGSAHLPQDRVDAEPGLSSTAIGAAPYVAEAMRWLPQDDEAAGAGLERDAARDRDAEGVRSGARERILVVDDNADMREYLTHLLRGWDVETAINGAVALERIRTVPPALVVTDVMMPELDGFELLHTLRSDPLTESVPVLMLSARAGEEARVSGLAAGADDYVTKPFSARELVARVRSLLALARARRDAELQKQHLRSLFMQAPTPMLILRGPEHVVELANPMTCQVWGRTEQDVLNKPLIEALPELRGQPFISLLDDVFRTGVPYLGKERPARAERRGDGSVNTIYFNFVYSPLRGLDGQIEGVLVLAFDITDEVNARNEMQHLRTAAESANRTKDEFLAMLGHELRNPLAPILTALQLMTLRGDTSSARERVVIERQVRHLGRLVDDLLDVSRIARGKIALRRQPLEMAEIVASAVESASPLLEERHHQLELKVPSTGLVVSGDVTRLTQVVMNVLTNAAKYTEPKGRISVTGQRVGDAVELSIKDTGIGISADMLPHVFEMFTQSHQASDRSLGGLGIGLTIVKSLVALHDGTVEARSPGVGKGSEFIIQLPSYAGEQARPTAPRVARVPDETVRTGYRVLIVDDNVDGARLIAEALEAVGHDTRVAFDGPAALAVAEEFKPDAALLDLGLPLMDGYELARQLVGSSNGVPPVLVAVTGYGQASDHERSRAAGFEAHIVKPVDVHQLTARLDQLLARRAPEKSSGATSRPDPHSSGADSPV